MAYWTVPWLKSVYNIYTGVSVQRPERGAQLLGGDVTVTVLEPHCHYCHKYVVWKYLVKQTEHFLRPCQLKMSMISVKKAFKYFLFLPTLSSSMVPAVCWVSAVWCEAWPRLEWWQLPPVWEVAWMIVMADRFTASQTRSSRGQVQ